jgi:hypothetical protein
MSDWVEHAIGRWVDRWTALDSDWQGVLVGAAIVVLITVFGVTVPW